MSGAPHRAREASLTFMLGGDDDNIKALRPLFEIMGSSIFHLGPLCAGMTVKVINNYSASAGVVAARRSFELAEIAGVDRNALMNVMRASSGNNWYVENIDAIDWADEGYDRNNTVGIMHKDVTCALDIVDGITNDLDKGVLQSLLDMRPLRK